MKYTVIYSEYSVRGSHTISFVRHAYIETNGDTLSTAIERYGIEMSQVHFILEGWLKLEGETDEPTESHIVR